MANERYLAGKCRSRDKSIYLHTMGLMTILGIETHPKFMVQILSQWRWREGHKVAR